MKNYETRHITLAFSIMFLMSIPIILLILPTAVIHTFYYHSQQLALFTPFTSYFVYGVGLFFVFLTIFSIFLLWGKKSMILAIIGCLTISTVFIIIAAQTYISIRFDGISYRFPSSKDTHHYQSHDLEKALYYEDENRENAPTYEFYFKDGQHLELSENAYLREVQFVIHTIIESEGIEFEKRFNLD